MGRRLATIIAALLLMAGFPSTALAKETKFLKSKHCCWAVETEEINGTVYGHTLHRWSNNLLSTCAGYTHADSKRVDLSRDWNTFKAVAGWVDKGSDSEAQGLFEVYLDGELAASRIVGFGEQWRMSVDVTDVLRMKLKVSVIDDDTCWSGDSGFGKARLIRP